jgi:hypothetical protein
MRFQLGSSAAECSKCGINRLLSVVFACSCGVRI